MEFLIESFKSAGPLLFGMGREGIRAALAPAKATPRLSFLNKRPFDVFTDLGVKVSYGLDERCEAVEFARPAEPVFRGHRFLRLRLREAKEQLEALDPVVKLDDDGLTSHRLGIGLYVPSAKKRPSGKIEGLIAFKPGYWDND